MAHLFLLRSCPGFVQAPNSINGQHERIELAINQRKYALNLTREGYNVPHSSEWKLMEYRLKKEIIGEFVRDHGGFNLNPSPNRVNLLKVIYPELHWGKSSVEVTSGGIILFVQWLFKWANRINVLLGTIVSILKSAIIIAFVPINLFFAVLYEFLMFVRGNIIGFPLKLPSFFLTRTFALRKHFDKLRLTFYHKRLIPILPVPVAAGNPVPFTPGWHYAYFIGVFPDPENGRGEEL